MERDYEVLKKTVNDIFESEKVLILAQKNIDISKTEMNLKIIQAVVMRFIRTILFRKNGIILCTSSNEIIKYVNTGFLRYFSEEQIGERKELSSAIEKLRAILEKVEKIQEN